MNLAQTWSFLVLTLALPTAFQSTSAHAEVLARSPAVYAQPTGITLDPKGELLYVADLGHGEIKVLVASNLDLLGEFGRDDLTAPAAVFMTADGELLVSDSGRDEVLLFQVNGTSAQKQAVLTEDLKDVGGACRLDSDTLFATSRGGNHVVRFDESSAILKTTTGAGGTLAFFTPTGIGCDIANQHVIIADSGNDRLVVLDRELNFIRAIGGRDVGFNSPGAVSVREDGLVFVADQNNDRIVVLDESDQIIDTFGDDILTQPAAVVSRGEHVWVTNTYGEQIVLFKWQQP